MFLNSTSANGFEPLLANKKPAVLPDYTSTEGNAEGRIRTFVTVFDNGCFQSRPGIG